MHKEELGSIAGMYNCNELSSGDEEDEVAIKKNVKLVAESTDNYSKFSSQNGDD